MRLAALLGVVAATFFVHGAHARPQGCHDNLAWQDRFPSWSPNGPTVAFMRQQVGCDPPPESLGFVTPGEIEKIYGSDGRRESWAPPSWAPSGLAVAYGRDRESVGVTAPTGPVGDDGPGLYPSWAVNSVVASVGTSVQALELIADTRRTLIPDYVKPTQSNGVAVWSPDHTRLALGVMLDPSDGGIAVIDADGSGFRVIAAGRNQSVNPTWSPDGRTVAFETNRDGDFEIYSVRADGSDVRNLTRVPDGEDRMPAWHGNTIAFISNRGKPAKVRYGYNLWTMSGDGSDQRERTGDLHPYSAVAWSPDGAQIAFSSGRECLRWGIYVLDVATGRDRRITNRCRFTGTNRDDVLRGTPFKDFIVGRGGNDHLYGGRGYDTLTGGPGRDVIICGPGRDAVIADRFDRVAADCERVRRG